MKTIEQKGLIHGIERFSIHDGPGVRTLVVTKGCPLRCRWCSSPYTQKAEPELMVIQSRCQGCGSCVAQCPEKAVTLRPDTGTTVTNRFKCTGCGACVYACVHGAREISGLYVTPSDLLHEVERDAPFYRRSGGGVTLGGGEPTQQAEFAGDFLKLCRDHGIHTVMETCGMTSWERLAPLLERLDLVYMDLKHMDSRRHKSWTGAANSLILENIRRTAGKQPLILRIPVIPGFNDDDVNIRDSAKFARTLGRNLQRLELLPYHQLGIHRYAELEQACLLDGVEPLSEKRMKALQETARSCGIAVEIGG